MLNTKFSPWPSFSDEEANSVRDVILSNKVNYWTGQEGREFEKEFADWIDSKYAIAVANGTLALELALNALELDAEDEVIVTPRTFIASISCVVNSGAIPVFADVDLNTQNLSAETIAPQITKKTKAIIVVHLAGIPADMDPIMDLAKKHDIFVIEDCSQAHGALYKGKSVGTFGHFGTWSFCQDKIMTTGGEGGMVNTNDKSFWAKMWAFKDHGKSFEAVYEREHPPGFRWVHEGFGSNYRMLEVQAVIGRYQLRKMPEWTKIRKQNADKINVVADKFNAIRRYHEGDGVLNAYYKHYLFINPDKLNNGWTRDLIVEEMNKQSVPCFQGSCSEVYLEKAFDNTDFRPKDRFPNSKELGETSLMFLVHPTLKKEEIDKTCEVLYDVLSKAFL